MSGCPCDNTQSFRARPRCQHYSYVDYFTGYDCVGCDDSTVVFKLLMQESRKPYHGERVLALMPVAWCGTCFNDGSRAKLFEDERLISIRPLRERMTVDQQIRWDYCHERYGDSIYTLALFAAGDLPKPSKRGKE